MNRAPSNEPGSVLVCNGDECIRTKMDDDLQSRIYEQQEVAYGIGADEGTPAR